MSILSKRRPYLESLGLPNDAETIKRVRAFAIRAGLTSFELAEILEMNPNTLRVYLNGNYGQKVGCIESNSIAIRALLKEKLDLYEIKHQLMTSNSHFATSEYLAVRDSMWSALRNGTAFLVDGPPGTQKTYTMRRVAEEINASGEGRAVYVYARVEHTPHAFLIEACAEAGIPNRGSLDQMIRKLRYFLSGGRHLFLVDEAQHLGNNGLEVLRQMLDLPPYFGVGLGGSHDLTVRLSHWRMEQWRSRLRKTHLLKGLSQTEATQIIQAELRGMDEQDIADTIADATISAKREDKPFKYISARSLFFAIEDTRKALSSIPQQAFQSQEQETIQ